MCVLTSSTILDPFLIPCCAGPKTEGTTISTFLWCRTSVLEHSKVSPMALSGELSFCLHFQCNSQYHSQPKADLGINVLISETVSLSNKANRRNIFQIQVQCYQIKFGILQEKLWSLRSAIIISRDRKNMTCHMSYDLSYFSVFLKKCHISPFGPIMYHTTDTEIKNHASYW